MIKPVLIVAIIAVAFYFLSAPSTEETHVHIERKIKATPEQIWPYITDPKYFSEKLGIPFYAHKTVNGRVDVPTGVRRINFLKFIPLLADSDLFVLDETTMEGTQKPNRFVYSVTRGLGFHNHIGTVTITADPEDASQSIVVWDMRANLSLWLHHTVGKATVTTSFNTILDKSAASLAKEKQ